MSDERDEQQASHPDEVVTVTDADDDGSVDDRWSHEQRLVIAALAAGESRASAARIAGVGMRTLVRWFEDHEFRAAVEEGRAAQVALVSGQLLDASTAAVRVLREGLEAERLTDRLRAAGLLLSHGLRFRQHAEVEERLCEIERQLGLRGEQTGEDL